jgi:hypothetical protein
VFQIQYQPDTPFASISGAIQLAVKAIMPLVKLFARSQLRKAIPLQPLQQRMCEIWGTQPDTTKLILFTCQDWTTANNLMEEDVYVDIRAYGKTIVTSALDRANTSLHRMPTENLRVHEPVISIRRPKYWFASIIQNLCYRHLYLTLKYR